MRKQAWVLMIVFILFFIPMVLYAYTSLGSTDNSQASLVTISSEQCQLRDGPGRESQVIGYVRKGQVYEVVSRFRDVLGIQAQAGVVGYISLNEAKAFEDEITNQEVILNSSYTGCSFTIDEQPKSLSFFLSASVAPANAAERDTSQVPIEYQDPDNEKSIKIEEERSTAKEHEPILEVEEGSVSETVEAEGTAVSEAVKPEVKPVTETVEPEVENVERPITEAEVEPKIEQVVAPANTVTTVSPETQSISLTQEEKSMYQLINDLRSSKGLCLLELDCELRDIARIKSKELVERDYFSHTSPVYGSPKEMLDTFNVVYDYMGETLAYDRNAKLAFDAFCNSKQHRDILLNPVFNHVGVGIQVDANDMIMVTVLLIDKP